MGDMGSWGGISNIEVIENITFYSYKRIMKCLLEHGTAWLVEANAL